MYSIFRLHPITQGRQAGASYRLSGWDYGFNAIESALLALPLPYSGIKKEGLMGARLSLFSKNPCVLVGSDCARTPPT
jgi:hypothetical protein